LYDPATRIEERLLGRFVVRQLDDPDRSRKQTLVAVAIISRLERRLVTSRWNHHLKMVSGVQNANPEQLI